MANNAPDEILTEILRPLLKHSDAAFSDTSEKPLLAVHGFEVSSYLLVNKAWLRASTPLLYSVVILRTTAQAVAVERVLKRYPDIGNYILKLRVEGGFGTAMHTILRCATRLRELFISLVISASDNVKGLCSGLPLVNPHSVYLYDRNYHRNGFAKNKKVDELLQTVISLIPKWNNLKLFDFPYFSQAPHLITQAGRRAIDTRAEKLISALVLSQTLETVLLSAGYAVPAYLSQLVSIPTLKTLQFRRGLAADYAWCSKEIEKHPKLLLYAEFPLWERDRGIEDPNEDAVLIGDFGTNSNQSDDDNRECTVTERKLELIQDLGKRCGNTITSLIAGGVLPTNNRPKPDEIKPLSLTILADFTALTKLTLVVRHSDPRLTKPGEEFCKTAFPKLEWLDLSRAAQETVDLFTELSLPSLHTVKATVAIGYAKTLPDAMTWNAFLILHGSKLRTLDILPFSGPTRGAEQWADMAPAEKALRTQLRIFELCSNLCNLTFRVVTSAPRGGAVVAPEKPHHSLARICFDANQLTQREEVAMRAFFLRLFNGDVDSETIENNMFPALREVKFTPIHWPTSEAAAAKHQWMMLAEKMDAVGIAVVDATGTKGERRARTGKSGGKGKKMAKGNAKQAKGKGKAKDSDEDSNSDEDEAD